jgi:hypothetical protein
MRYVEVIAQLALEAFDFRTADEPLAVADARDGVEDGLAKRRVLCVEVQQRNGHKPSMLHPAGSTTQISARPDSHLRPPATRRPPPRL